MIIRRILYSTVLYVEQHISQHSFSTCVLGNEEGVVLYSPNPPPPPIHIGSGPQMGVVSVDEGLVCSRVE